MHKGFNFSILFFILSGTLVLEWKINDFDNEMSVKANDTRSWGEVLIPLWADSENSMGGQRLGPILIVVLSILTVFALLKYYNEKEVQKHEY